MTLSPEEEAAYNVLCMRVQRDVNCLTDADRTVRRRGVDKLHRALQYEAPRVSDAVLRALCMSHLLRPLLQCAERDVVEKCREQALRSLLFLCEHGALEQSNATLKEIVALIDARLGTFPFPEPTEEIRLLLLQLLYAFLTQLAAVHGTLTSLQDVITELANALSKTAVDPFPDAKKMSAECVILIARTWKHEMCLQIGTIVRPMIANLGHQHSRVRVCALQALEAAVPCGSEALPHLMKELLLPVVSIVVLDQSPSVRKQLVVTLATWMAQSEQIEQFEASVFPIFLAGVADDAPDVRVLCLAKLNDLSVIWESRGGARGVGPGDELMEVDSEPASSIPPFFFDTRPPIGARNFAASITAQVLPFLLEKTGDWTARVRERYTKVLAAYLILLEQIMNPFLDDVFAAMGKTCRDDEEIVCNSVKACLVVVGFYADPRVILASLRPMIAGTLTAQGSTQHRTNGLKMLRMCIEGMTKQTIDAHLESITEALCDAALCESEVSDLQDNMAGVVASIVKAAGSMLAQRDDSCFRIFWILSHLLASSSESSVACQTASKCMNELATHMKQPVETLYTCYMGRLMDAMALPSTAAASWQKNNPTRLLFDSLCRRGGVACFQRLDKIVPVLVLHLEPAQDADVRLAFLALMETMLERDTTGLALRSFSGVLLQKAIMPNIFCHGERIAATIRKVAVACACTCLRQGIVDESCLTETAPQVLLVLRSAIDDSDANTRQLVCLALQYLFLVSPGCLGEEPVQQLHSEILKRLDDSNDIVRKTACQTLATFLKAAPKKHVQGPIIDYTLDCLFVHLDDSEPEIQEAVYSVLRETVAIDAPRLVKKAKESRGRHQNTRYCEQLLSLATAAKQSTGDT
uniref:Dynein assembly factor 5, axonemal n=1 Tax=Peronospora matthiolae TaxID=2874970 RepID=A0AAV1T385_9STRA